jgi:hypothetical protein
VLHVIEQLAPVLDPDLILYGFCLNDFLPTGVGQYNHNWSVPLPMWFKNLTMERTRIGRFLDDVYRQLLIRLGVSMDFFDDILKDFGNYQERFAADTVNMEKFATAHDLPSVVAIVLDQYPATGGRGHRIAEMAESLMRKAGFDVVSTDTDHSLYVSRWEGHPNEEANAIFATMIANHLYDRADIEKHRRRK